MRISLKASYQNALQELKMRNLFKSFNMKYAGGQTLHIIIIDIHPGLYLIPKHQNAPGGNVRRYATSLMKLQYIAYQVSKEQDNSKLDCNWQR